MKISKTSCNVWCDNKSVINVANNQVQHHRNKYVGIDGSFIKEKLVAHAFGIKETNMCKYPCDSRKLVPKRGNRLKYLPDGSSNAAFGILHRCGLGVAIDFGHGYLLLSHGRKKKEEICRRTAAPAHGRPLEPPCRLKTLNAATAHTRHDSAIPA